MAKSVTKTRAVLVTLDEEERRLLKLLTQKRGMNMSVVVRFLIRDAAAKDGLS